MSTPENEVDVNNQDNAPPDRDWEAEAKAIGWRPKETFKGDPEKWTDAKTYVERGEQFIPLLRHANQELKGRLNGVEQSNEDLRRQLAVANKSLEELKEETREGNVESAETRKSALYDAIAQAREANDVRQELQLREQLDDLNQEIRSLKAKPNGATQPTQPQMDYTKDPVHIAFMEENPWFGVDQEKSSLALGYMNYLNGNPETVKLSRQEKYDAVAKRIADLFPAGGNSRRTAPSKVEGGRTGGSGGRNSDGSRGFEALPADARSQCDKQSTRFVGKADSQGKVKYPDLNSYRAHYASLYFDEGHGTKQMTGG